MTQHQEAIQVHDEDAQANREAKDRAQVDSLRAELGSERDPDINRSQIKAISSAKISWAQGWTPQEEKYWTAIAHGITLPHDIKVHACPTEDRDGTRVYYAHIDAEVYGPYVDSWRAKQDAVKLAYSPRIGRNCVAWNRRRKEWTACTS